MPNLHLSTLLLAGLAAALLVAASTDIRRREIDNTLTAAIALTAPLFWWASALPLWPDIAWQVGVALIALAALTALFATGLMGGGDVKLLVALALWIQPLWFLRLLMVMALAGGVLTLAMALWHFAPHRKALRSASKLQVPYGVAISAAGLWVLAVQNLPTNWAVLLPGSAG